MKEYIVTVDGNQWDNLFLVSAQNSKTAIDMVWDRYFSWRVKSDREKGYRPTAKYELHAVSIAKLYTENGNIVKLN